MDIKKDTSAEKVKAKKISSFSKSLKIILTIIAAVAIFLIGYALYVVESEQHTSSDSTATTVPENSVMSTSNQEQGVTNVVDSSDPTVPDTSEKTETKSFTHGVENFPGLTFFEPDFINDDSFWQRVVVAKTDNFSNIFESLTAGDVIDTAKAEIDISDNSTRLKNYQSEKVDAVLTHYKNVLTEKGYEYVGSQSIYPVLQTSLKQSTDNYFLTEDESSAFVVRHTILTTSTGATDTSDKGTYFVDKEIFEIAYVENLSIEWEEEKFVSPSGRYVASIINGDAYGVRCGYRNDNCFFQIVDTFADTSFLTKLRNFPSIDIDGTVSNHIIKVKEVLWTNDDELYLVGGTRDGGYWAIDYNQFNLNENRAAPVFTAGGGECPERSYRIYDASYWLHDANSNYNVCFDTPLETSDSGYAVYNIDRDNDFSQTFITNVPDEMSFLNQFAQDLPSVVLNHYKNQ